MPHIPGTWRLLYFDAPTRGEQIRVLFSLAGVPFHDVRFPFPRGLDPYKKEAMGDASPLLGTNMCPAITSPAGEHCVETADIMRFVGRQVGLGPATAAEDARAVELTLLAQRTLDTVFYPLLFPMIISRLLEKELFGALRFLRWGVAGASKTGPPTKVLREILSELEAALASNSDSSYLVGPSLSYADAAVFTVLDQCFSYSCFDQVRRGRDLAVRRGPQRPVRHASVLPPPLPPPPPPPPPPPSPLLPPPPPPHPPPPPPPPHPPPPHPLPPPPPPPLLLPRPPRPPPLPPPPLPPPPRPQAEELKSLPKLAAFMQIMLPKLAGFYATRTRDHQLGISDLVDYLVATNTPFPWSRRSKPPVN